MVLTSGKRRILKMIDNPLPDQVMEEKEALYVNEQFEEHCADRAKELAEINYLKKVE